MRLSRKIMLAWIGIQVIYFTCLLIFPHHEIVGASLINRGIQSLLLVISLFIYKKEPNKKNRFVFLNFSLFFFALVMIELVDFAGVAFFKNWTFASHVFLVYGVICWELVSSLTVAYIVFDLLFREFGVLQKYLLSLSVTVFFAILYYHPFFGDPLYLYSTEDIKQWKTLSSQLSPSGEMPSALDLAGRVRLQSWQDGHAVGDLYPDENIKRIEYLLPYLEGRNWLILFYKPLYMSNIYMNVMFIVFILLFFGYQYKKDPPQGAYIDKIMFLLLLFSSMEILHNWGYIKTVEYSLWGELFSVGQYITVLIELLMVLFFSLRLKFITSVQGEFYETELATNPHQVSRWRDWVDNLILAHFFNFRLFNGRLFQNPDTK